MPNDTKPVTCTAEECVRPLKAKGLCTKHYMRLRRTGDPATTRRPGRTRSLHRTFLRDLMADAMSDSTFARYYDAFTILTDLATDATHTAAIAAATRPNGSFNVAKYERQATRALVAYVRELEAS